MTTGVHDSRNAPSLPCRVAAKRNWPFSRDPLGERRETRRELAHAAGIDVDYRLRRTARRTISGLTLSSASEFGSATAFDGTNDRDAP